MNHESASYSTIRLPLKLLTRVAVGLVVALLILGIFADILAAPTEEGWRLGFLSLFSHDYSQNLPHWYSMILFAFGGLLAVVLAVLDEAGERPAAAWLALAVIMLGFSAEALTDASFTLGAVLRGLIGPAALGDLMIAQPVLAAGLLAVIVILAAAAAVFAYRGLKAWWSLPPACRGWLGFAFAVLAFASLVEPRLIVSWLRWLTPLGEPSAAPLFVSIELLQSLLRSIAASVICLALLKLLSQLGRPIIVQFGEGARRRQTAASDGDERRSLPVGTA